MTTCSIYSFFLTILIILIIAFVDDIFSNVPALSKLFTDPINFILLVTLCILVLLLDMPSGILLAFLILYLAVWIRQWHKKKQERFNDIITTSNVINNKKPLSDIPHSYTSESEINYNRPNISNGNISPFQPVSQENITNLTPQIQPAIACNQDDSLSQVGPLNRDGYDYVGCRYDMKDSPQNLTKWGSPLARCSTYNSSKVNTFGTVFYPLHS